MMEALEPYGTVFGADSSSWAIASARGRGHRRVEQAMVEHLPFQTGSFDLVTCLDVIEHIPDDERALAELWRVTAAGGHLLITVPAYQALWSAHDSMNHHFRRYRAGTLRQLAEGTGWEVERATYFNSILLAPAAIVRLARKLFRVGGRRSELSLTPAALDRVLVLPMRLEAALLRCSSGPPPSGLVRDRTTVTTPFEPRSTTGLRQSSSVPRRAATGGRPYCRASQSSRWSG